MRQMVDTVGNTEDFEKLIDMRIGKLPTVEQGRHDDIFQRRKHRNQIVILEDEADVFAAVFGKLLAFQLIDIASVDIDGAAGRNIKTAAQLKQCTFTGTGCADNRNKFAFFHGKVAGLDRGNDIFTLMVYLC